VLAFVGFCLTLAEVQRDDKATLGGTITERLAALHKAHPASWTSWTNRLIPLAKRRPFSVKSRAGKAAAHL